MANFEFNCPHCNQALEAPDEMLGQTIECPSCSKAINLPTPAPTSPPIPLQIETKACPFCGEEILAKAMKCKHCGEFLDETLRRQAQTEPHRSSGNPVHHVQSFVCWFTGLQQLQGFRIKTLVSDVFKRRTKEDIDAYFECGGPHATPLIANVPTEWPHRVPPS